MSSPNKLPVKRKSQDMSDALPLLLTTASDAVDSPPPTDAASFDYYLVRLLAFKSRYNSYNINRDDQPNLHAWLQFVRREYKTTKRSADNEEPVLIGVKQQSENLDTVVTTTSPFTDDHWKLLEHLHIPLTFRGDEHWLRFYDFLVDYKRTHGHVLVPRICEVPGLGEWVIDQRRQYKAWKNKQASYLTKFRRDKLEELGFVWQVRQRPEWDDRYKELVVYKEQYGNCKVPQHYSKNRPLGKWVAKQREQYKMKLRGEHSFMTPYREEKLNEIGFVWQVKCVVDESDIVDNNDGDAVADNEPEATNINDKTDVQEGGNGNIAV